MFSAISFGVFWRCAPSTRAIIRSMNVSPGFDVIWTTMRSDRTFVPPVTALRSPPDSRITGADSPVIADSSTDATPSTTSPSPGMISFASTTHRSPGTSCAPDTSSSEPSARSRRAIVSLRAARSVAACAFPRPSATASAMFANSTVSQSHTVIWPAKSVGSSANRIVVSTAPTSTTNMTGFFAIVRGCSFRKASGSEVEQHLQVHFSNPSTIGPSDSAGK